LVKIIKDRKRLTLAGITVIAFVFVTLLIIGFIYEERNKRRETIINLLSNEANRDAAIVYNLFDSYIDTLQSLSVYIQRFDDLESAQTIGFLRTMAESFGFERLSVGFSDGRSYTTDGLALNITQNDFLETIRSGQVFISDLMTSNIDGAPSVYIGVPIYKYGSPVASLGYELKRERLNNLLQKLLSEDGKYSYFMDEYGEFVAFVADSNIDFSPENNLFYVLGRHTYGAGLSKELVMEDFANATSGYTEYSSDGVERYAYYAPVGINNWMVMTVMSKNAIDADTDRFLRSAIILAAQILLIFLVVALFVFREQKKAREKAQLDEQCFRILAEHTGNAVIEWDYSEKIMYSSNFEKAIGQKPLKDILRSADDAINAGAVHPDDCDLYRKTFSDTVNGQGFKDVRIRMRATDEDYQYYSLSSVVVHDAKGKPYKSIAFLENIDEQVRRENVLLQKANTDPLTGFYNKAAAETFISEIMFSSANGMAHTLMCVDLDNFKSINDLFGHLYGDDVLKEVASIMKNLFRSDDVLGRFGGDEFVVFVRAIPNVDFVKEKAAELNRCLNKTYEKDGVKCTISASIGIAIFPSDGVTYSDLHKKADEASYAAKKSGKNTYRFAAAPDGNSLMTSTNSMEGMRL
jgi:diguanylate cyclase (GGDEF)-like protein